MTGTARCFRFAVVVVCAAMAVACDANPAGPPATPASPAADLQRRNEEARTEIAKLVERNEELNAQLRELEARLADLRSGTDAAPAGAPTETPQTTQGAREPIRAVVQAVDNRVDVFVISIGSKDGVALGTECAVTRGGETVTTLVVDKVFPNYASARTKPGTAKRDVRSGDEATIDFAPAKSPR